jgi:alkanesulfonate monooxygenase SsuD/methylene tetrahydromethanopterin reductase-like flavin-dependent oxidoreductase (luciferase family)
VLIKRTDATGDWYVYDTLRGMTTLTDPYVLVNSAAAQTATLGSVTTVSTGFALNSTILAAINVNTGSYIFLAIA